MIFMGSRDGRKGSGLEFGAELEMKRLSLKKVRLVRTKTKTSTTTVGACDSLLKKEKISNFWKRSRIWEDSPAVQFTEKMPTKGIR
ncbi:hypothetical protein U1Q18_011912 [Sarracenia purpurea var. burkii]